ncbi:hypothetical protein Theos_2273 (plasmid) [Thermus oshimai JL-2]|uniref:Bacterial sensory transduction regulator n=1 Tax=Thermus oshimai JL-2 TaxID=751945 RepID=K7RLK6_THEOS|nr:hypothetical protein [Thermus oshimai]AFV77262.1 hypothetical protein Theos_2273 [Thermus oshimai JL-2]
MHGILEDLSSWLGERGYQILGQKVDGDGDGFLGFTPPGVSLRYVLVLQREDDGLFFYALHLTFGDLKPPEPVLLGVAARIKGVKAFLDGDGDLVLGVEGFTHDPHALPFVLPTLVEALQQTALLLGFWKVMGDILPLGGRA